LAENMPGGRGLRFVQIKGLGPIRGKIRKILINLQKISSHKPVAEIYSYTASFGQVCSNIVPRVMYDPIPGA